MAGVLSSLRKRFGRACNICSEVPSELKAFRKSQQDWRYACTNDKEVQRDDPELNAIEHAEQLQWDDPAAAFLQLVALAERGSAWSMMLTGYAYLDGLGVAADQAAAEQWFRRAASLGCQQAQLRLGQLHMNRGDYAESERIYSVGASGIWSPSTYYLAVAKLRQADTPQQREEARILLERAAAQGDIEAELDLAVLTMKGRFGLRRIPASIPRSFKAASKVVAFGGKSTAASNAA